MKKRTLLLSVTIFTLALVTLVGATFALFTDSVTLNTHLNAGTLDVKLVRTYLLTESINEDTGFIVRKEDDTDIDFSDVSAGNIFDVTDKTLIVPGSKFSADLDIINNANVAFNYYIEIVFKGGNDNLASQLKVIVDTGTKTEGYVGAGVKLGSEERPLGTLGKGTSKSINVTVQFLDLSSNNEVQGKTVEFDMIVHAVQVTTVQ